MAKFIKQDRIKPENVEINGSIEIHADVLATFKTYVSRYNKDRDWKLKFQYHPFIGSFCKAERMADVFKKKPVKS